MPTVLRQGSEQVEARRDLPAVWPEPPVPRGARGTILQRIPGGALGAGDQFICDFGGRQATAHSRDLRKPISPASQGELIQHAIKAGGALLALLGLVEVLRVVAGAMQHAITILVVLLLVRLVFKAVL